MKVTWPVLIAIVLLAAPLRAQLEAKQQQLRAQLTPPPPPPPPSPVVLVLLPPAGREPRPKWRIITGAVSLGVGLGLVGAGSWALAVNGQCQLPPCLPDGT